MIMFMSPLRDQPCWTAAAAQKPSELVYGSAEEFLHKQLLPT
jgi:hypothetical protein